MDDQAKENTNSKLKTIWLYFTSPISDTILYKYLPLHGFINFTGMSISILCPEIYAGLIPWKYFGTLNNIMLLSSNLGTGLYLFDRQHMRYASTGKRLTYTLFGSILFNFGAVMMWGILRACIQSSSILRFFLALSSSAGLLILASSYLEYVDNPND